MRRVAPDEVAKGAGYLESQFTETLEDETFLQELETGILCNPGEDCQMVNVLLTGEDFPATGAECLPVLGGEHVATLGRPFDVLLVLKPELERPTEPHHPLVELRWSTGIFPAKRGQWQCPPPGETGNLI